MKIVQAYLSIYGCVCVVVIRPWAHNRKVVSSSLAHAPVEMWCSYSFSITMWCEKSINTSPPVHLAANGNLEFSGVQIHWPFLIHQPGSGGTSGAHTSGWERWSVLLRVPSQAPGVCSVLAPSAFLMHRQPGSAR